MSAWAPASAGTLCVLINRRVEASAFAGMADVAIAEALHFQEQRVIVAISEHLKHLKLVAGGLALHPQLVAGAAEEGGKAGLLGEGQRFFVHEADHEHFLALRILNDRRNQPVQFREIHNSPT